MVDIQIVIASYLVRPDMASARILNYYSEMHFAVAVVA